MNQFWADWTCKEVWRCHALLPDRAHFVLTHLSLRADLLFDVGRSLLLRFQLISPVQSKAFFSHNTDDSSELFFESGAKERREYEWKCCREGRSAANEQREKTSPLPAVWGQWAMKPGENRGREKVASVWFTRLFLNVLIKVKHVFYLLFLYWFVGRVAPRKQGANCQENWIFPNWNQ